MRVKVKKLLRGGEYHISLENLDFNEEEAQKIEKFGMPCVDFSSDGLGTRRLDEINLSMKCQTPQEAEEMIGKIKQSIKGGLTELLNQVDTFSGEDVVEI
jgi:Glu-tRNA(Gln) amidotransferase subunit E-like FAD-binding protein